jgi:hypothetical protein
VKRWLVALRRNCAAARDVDFCRGVPFFALCLVTWEVTVDADLALRRVTVRVDALDNERVSRGYVACLKFSSRNRLRLRDDRPVLDEVDVWLAKASNEVFAASEQKLLELRCFLLVCNDRVNHRADLFWLESREALDLLFDLLVSDATEDRRRCRVQLWIT